MQLLIRAPTSAWLFKPHKTCFPSRRRHCMRPRLDHMTGKKKGGPVDAIVGRTIRVHRLQQHLSQSALGRTIGVSFQQIQKYENGSNRVGASRLVQIAQALHVPLDMFFQRVDSPAAKRDGVEDPVALLSNSQALRVARAFSAISDSRIRISIVMLLETIARSRR